MFLVDICCLKLRVSFTASNPNVEILSVELTIAFTHHSDMILSTVCRAIQELYCFRLTAVYVKFNCDIMSFCNLLLQNYEIEPKYYTKMGFNILKDN